MSAISRLSVELFLRSFSKITFKHGNVADFRAFFSSRLDGFSLTDPSQKLKKKKPWKGPLDTKIFSHFLSFIIFKFIKYS